MYRVTLSFDTINAAVGIPAVGLLVTDAETGNLITGLDPQQFAGYYYESTPSGIALTPIPSATVEEVNSVTIPGFYLLLSAYLNWNLLPLRSYTVIVTISETVQDFRSAPKTTVLGVGIGTYVNQVPLTSQ